MSFAEAAAAAPDASPKAGQEDEQTASNRFSEHVAGTNSNFARKFGHYKQHLADGQPSEGDSSTGDDSQKTGSFGLDNSVHREQDWQVKIASFLQHQLL